MDIKQTMKRPAVVWTGLTILLIIGALLVPMEWVDSFGDFLGEAEPRHDAFSEEVAAIDEDLAEERELDVSAERLDKLVVHLQARRLLDAGPMTAGQMREATEILAEYNRQLATQREEGSREAIRNERNRQLAEAFPRLDDDKLAAELEGLRDDLRRAGFTDLSERI